MSEKKDGGPVYPEIRKVWTADGSAWHEEFSQGMTLRDYFAGQALISGADHAKPGSDFQGLARWAYQIANAMLAERDR